MKTALKSWAAACALVLAGSAGAVGVPGQGTWETTLQPRDLDGDTVTDAFYDTELNITWLRTVNPTGRTSASAKVWAEGYGAGWRLPTMIDTGTPGCDFSWIGGTDSGFNVRTKEGATVFSEMAHLYYVTLGNKAYCPGGPASCASAPSGSGLTNTGDFLGLGPGSAFWTDVDVPRRAGTWSFFFHMGNQDLNCWTLCVSPAIVVRPGDVTAVPEPEAAALMPIGLGALVVAARRRRLRA